MSNKVKRNLREGIVDMENFIAVGWFGPSVGPRGRLWEVRDEWEMESNENDLGGLD